MRIKTLYTIEIIAAKLERLTKELKLIQPVFGLNGSKFLIDGGCLSIWITD